MNKIRLVRHQSSVKERRFSDSHKSMIPRNASRIFLLGECRRVDGVRCFPLEMNSSLLNSCQKRRKFVNYAYLISKKNGRRCMIDWPSFFLRRCISSRRRLCVRTAHRTSLTNSSNYYPTDNDSTAPRDVGRRWSARKNA